MEKASEILAPPSTKTQGRRGLSITDFSAVYSSTSCKPPALGRISWKATMEGAFRWAAAKASFTYRSARGARLRTSQVSSISCGLSFTSFSKPEISSAR